MSYLVSKYPNWRGAIETVAAISTFLAGFSLTMALLSLRLDTTSIAFVVFQMRLATHSIALFLLAMATLLFITSVQCLLRARSYNYYDIKNGLVEQMEKEARQKQGDLQKYIAGMDSKCRAWYDRGAFLFNLAVIVLLAGSAVLLYPYSVVVAGLLVAGMVIEIVWGLLDH